MQNLVLAGSTAKVLPSCPQQLAEELTKGTESQLWRGLACVMGWRSWLEGQRKEEVDQTLWKNSQVPTWRSSPSNSWAYCSHLARDNVYVSSGLGQAQQAVSGSQLNITTRALTDQQWPAGKDSQGCSCQPEVLGLTWRLSELARERCGFSASQVNLLYLQAPEFSSHTISRPHLIGSDNPFQTRLKT